MEIESGVDGDGHVFPDAHVPRVVGLNVLISNLKFPIHVITDQVYPLVETPHENCINFLDVFWNSKVCDRFSIPWVTIR